MCFLLGCVLSYLLLSCVLSCLLSCVHLYCLRYIFGCVCVALLEKRCIWLFLYACLYVFRWIVWCRVFCWAICWRIFRLSAFVLLAVCHCLCMYGWALREQHAAQKTVVQLNSFDLIRCIRYYSKKNYPNKKNTDLFIRSPNADEGQSRNSNIENHYSELLIGASQFLACPAQIFVPRQVLVGLQGSQLNQLLKRGLHLQKIRSYSKILLWPSYFYYTEAPSPQNSGHILVDPPALVYCSWDWCIRRDGEQIWNSPWLGNPEGLKKLRAYSYTWTQSLPGKAYIKAWNDTK